MLDLNSLKEHIQTIFETANTTTASVDLSKGLETRVQRILKLNPERIPVQAQLYPFVTIFISDKAVTMMDIAGNQLIQKRKGEISVKVVGAVWNSTITDSEEDPADEDCESLMENVEEILRANPQLGGSQIGTAVIGTSTIGPIVAFSHPTKITYHNFSLDEGTHIRAGVLDLEVTVLY